MIMAARKVMAPHRAEMPERDRPTSRQWTEQKHMRALPARRHAPRAACLRDSPPVDEDRSTTPLPCRSVARFSHLTPTPLLVEHQLITRDSPLPLSAGARGPQPRVGAGSSLLPAVISLLRRITETEPAIWESDARTTRLAVSLEFKDGVGQAEVLADVFAYRGALGLTLWIDHNRVFATRDGRPTPLRCFLNDYVASIRLAPDARTLPDDFVRTVVAGVAAARDGVRRYNRHCHSHWFRVNVAERSR